MLIIFWIWIKRFLKFLYIINKIKSKERYWKEVYSNLVMVLVDKNFKIILIIMFKVIEERMKKIDKLVFIERNKMYIWKLEKI